MGHSARARHPILGIATQIYAQVVLSSFYVTIVVTEQKLLLICIFIMILRGLLPVFLYNKTQFSRTQILTRSWYM